MVKNQAAGCTHKTDLLVLLTQASRQNGDVGGVKVLDVFPYVSVS
jgi:hypothetical protein